MTREQKFFDALKDVFVGAKIEGESGFINLMRIKSRYYSEYVFPKLQQDIDQAIEPFPVFREELFDKLYEFFHRYFTESGSIYFRYTPLHQNVYEKVYTEDRDVMLFWKTHMLYYVKTDRLYQSMQVELDEQKLSFDVSILQHKKANEKRALVYAFREKLKDGTLVFEVTYSERGRKTRVDEILREIRREGSNVSRGILDRWFRIFEKQSGVDYFVNKDAKAFLQEQYDLWAYQYIFKGESQWTQQRIRQLQVLRELAFRIIDFISQFEDELVKIWTKPRFVLNSCYVVTVDRISKRRPDLVEKLVDHKGFADQVREWLDLGLVRNDFDPESFLTSNSGQKQAAKAYRFLPVDTKHFKDLELQILAEFENLDRELDGWLISSENYQALNTVLNKFRGTVDTIYIDPPFNLETEGDFYYTVKYKDSTWVSLLENRIRLARELLSDIGGIYVRCDHNGNMLVRMLMDELFGEDRFGNEIVINRFRRQLADLTRFNIGTDSLFYYTKSSDPHFVTIYRKRICSFCGQEIQPQWRGMSSPGLRRPPERVIEGRELLPPRGRHWTFAQARIDEMTREGRIRVNEGPSYTDLDGNRVRGIPEYLQTEETPIDSVWTDLKGYVFGAKFPTENPEELVKRVIDVSSPSGGMVMDFFLGSGTTTATAHKLGRKWIGVELPDNFRDFALPRMKRVLAGDASGISSEVSWSGGGFFKYFELEQYEDTLRRAHYEEADLFTDPYKDPYSEYIFMRDLKLLEALEATDKEGNVKVDLGKLFSDIDLPETLSNVLGKWISRIEPDSVEFEDGEKVDTANLDWKRIKPLIWW